VDSVDWLILDAEKKKQYLCLQKPLNSYLTFQPGSFGRDIIDSYKHFWMPCDQKRKRKAKWACY